VVEVAELEIEPAADDVFPAAPDVTTTVNTPVAISISLSGLVTADTEESVLIVLDGVPAGASFNNGTDLGDGQWAFAPSDLVGLTFTPPPGATGVFTFEVSVISTDSAPGVTTSTADEPTTFTVTVTAPTPSTPTAPELPAGPAAPVLIESSAEVSGPTGANETEPPSDAADHPITTVYHPGATFVSGYSSGSAVSVHALPAEQRASTALPAPGSLFVQAEAPLPSYVLGERHPLPPVLPLDQTLPVAGFTESGGDSLALVDKLYRDAGAVSAPTSVSQAPVESAPGADTNTKPSAEQVTRVLLGAGPAPAGDTNPAAVADETAEADDQWRAWAAGTAIAGSLAAWVWLVHGRRGFLARTVRRFFRDAQPRSTERTA
jgi:hypothetical protein